MEFAPRIGLVFSHCATSTLLVLHSAPPDSGLGELTMDPVEAN
jgi:hypothetical protein